jgi:DNA end-binding protein Ku
MARAIWSGHLSFGLVSLPVGLFTATTDRTVHFNQLHKGTSNRIRYKKVDEATGDEVPNDEIVNGFALGGGEYVVVTKDELKDVAPGRSENIEISDFVDLSEIDPLFFRGSYYLAPRGKGADRAYQLLREAMTQTNKVGIATLILRDKEHLVTVRPGDDVLIVETMYFADEIREPSEELETLPEKVTFEGRELTVAKQLVESLTTDWDPATYTNTYRQRVEELVEKKRAGQAIVAEAKPKRSNVIDLMSALEASISKGAKTSESNESEGVATRTKPKSAKTGTATKRSNAATSARAKVSPRAELEFLSKAELLARAVELDIAGRSKMAKPELVDAILAADAPPRRKRKVS